jgi:hypothetical protein
MARADVTPDTWPTAPVLENTALFRIGTSSTMRKQSTPLAGVQVVVSSIDLVTSRRPAFVVVIVSVRNDS